MPKFRQFTPEKTTFNDTDVAILSSDEGLGTTKTRFFQLGTFKTWLSSSLNMTNYYTKWESDTKIAQLVNSSPALLDTLGEIATALGNDANFATTIINALATKALDSAVVHIAGSETITGVKTFSQNTLISKTNFGASKDINWLYQNLWTIEVWYAWANWSDWYFGINAPATTPYNTEPIRAITVLSNGNVGIGKTNPTQKLDVNWTIISRWEIIIDNWIADGSQVVFKSSGYNDMAIDNSSGEFRIYNATLGQVYFTLTQANWDLTWKWQNWTSAWDTWTPILSGSWGWSGATATWTNVRYKIMWKTLFFQKRWSITAKGTCTGDFQSSIPPWFSSVSGINQSISGGIFPSWTMTSRWFPLVYNSKVVFTAAAWASILAWSAVAVGDEVFVGGTIEIA